MSPRLPIPPRLPRLLTTRTSTSSHRPPPYLSNILTLSTSPRLKRKKLLLSLPLALRLAPHRRPSPTPDTRAAEIPRAQLARIPTPPLDPYLPLRSFSNPSSDRTPQ